MLGQLAIHPGEKDFEKLWKRHADTSSLMPTHLDYQQFLATFVTFATQQYVDQTGPEDASMPPRSKSSMQMLRLDCSSGAVMPATGRSTTRSTARGSLAPTARSHTSMGDAAGPEGTERSHRSVASRGSELPAGVPVGLQSAKKKGAVFDFATKASGPISSRSGRESARSQHSRAAVNVFSKSKPLPPIAMAVMRPTSGHRHALSRLKMDVLDHSLTLVKALKKACPGGTASPQVFFDTLEASGVHCTEAEVTYIVTQLTDGANNVRYPLFFEVFASMKDHHDASYANGYFQDGSYEAWQAQQGGMSSA